MSFETTVRAFATALDEPSAPPPVTTHGRMGAPDARRFAVYRNNVAVGLIGAIEARYPVSRRIAGDEPVPRHGARIRARAQAAFTGHDRLWRGVPGVRLRLSREGLDAGQGLADVARLENAWVEAYHAEDASVGDVGELAALSPDCLAGTRIAFHPAARLLRFATPAASIWASAQNSGPSGRAHRGIRRRRAHHASRLRRPRARPAAARLRFRSEPARGRDIDRSRRGAQ